ncbi:MAG TPA: NAD-dependent succinate-semialdehyde dehydrogenase [Gemmatimonadaceae bacterium]|jgi:succinate-semialdehyde dehydrogenase/glutarate-semialdehyde dehydrogenase|nr:NAD-dependent succinate-semialdehyde dehydrogenase [Gemmatimonadaceae bacterium]
MAIETVNPATGERIRSFAALTEREIEDKISSAYGTARTWRDAPMDERARIVRRAGELLDERKTEYGRLMTLEMGKPYAAAVQEAAKCATACRFYADHAPEFLADEVVESSGERGYVAFEPIGVVLAVMPWNFPFWQVVRFAAPALAAGNVGLLKHASNVPQCALALEQLFLDAGAPGGAFQTLLIESHAVAKLIADDRIAAVTLTGSDGAGASVGAAAGTAVKKTVLELGGSDPFIVMPSADVDAAAKTAVNARTLNNGQSCICAKRFIVADAVADRFIQQFVERMRALIVGDPMDERTNIGPLATKSIRDDLHDQVTRSVAGGARLLTGGRPRVGDGFYYEPTVLVDLPPDSPALREETFGPVAAIVRVSNADDAIRVANDSRFGLGAAAWTKDADEIARFSRGLAAGNVFINGMVASDPRFPFGGVKKSGHGRELSAFGIREFVNVKTVRVMGG